MINCKLCGNKLGCWFAGEDHVVDECDGYVKTTNADRIRHMTDEELAECFLKTAICPCDAITDGCNLNDDTCKQAWLKLLREEVKE